MMDEFEKQIWTAVYASEYIRFRAISEELYSLNPGGYMKPNEAGIEWNAAKIAQEAVEKYRKVKQSEDAPYYFLERG